MKENVQNNTLRKKRKKKLKYHICFAKGCICQYISEVTQNKKIGWYTNIATGSVNKRKKIERYF